MKFQTLEDAEAAYKQLDEGCRQLLAGVKGMNVVLAVLAATHPNYDQFQLALTTAFEGPGMNVFGKDMSADELQAFRSVVEQIERTRQVSAKIDPLSGRSFG